MLFSIDFHGVLRIGRNITEEDVSVHVLKVGPCDNCMFMSFSFFLYVFLVFIVSQFIECFHMTSWRPCWCPKTKKWRPCWCPELNL